MISDAVQLWTPLGFKSIGDISAGDRTISYNEHKGYNEYDSFDTVETTWRNIGTIGVHKVGYSFTQTTDHPILVFNRKTKLLNRMPIDKKFMHSMLTNNVLLSNMPFEPYRRSNELDYIEWTARMAASFSRQVAPPLCLNEIWGVLKDITAIEAQVWLNTFFHWGILKPRVNFMKTILLRSSFVRSMLFHVAPRAGVAAYWGSYVRPGYHLGTYAFSIGINGLNPVAKSNWRAGRHEGIMYSVATKNGNFLAKHAGSTMLLACNYYKKGEKC